ncbi:MAG: hydrolase [Desulfuromonadales bacterium]|nr:hydrolase [Desulfuromonadales bacterium]
MLNKDNTLLLVIDIQGNLAQAMHDKESLFENAQKFIQGAKVFDIPIIVTEQIPAKLGPTIPEIARHLEGITPIPKESFSCFGCPQFLAELNRLGRREILLTGIEAHICVYQTAMSLLAAGYGVQIVADAVSSRTKTNKKIGIKRMKAEGARLTSTEMALFELLGSAANPLFKEIFKIIK